MLPLANMDVILVSFLFQALLSMLRIMGDTWSQNKKGATLWSKADTFDVVYPAARAKTACVAMYNPGTLKVSNIISPMYSRFSGAVRGLSVSNI